MKKYYGDGKGIVIYHGRAEDVLPELGKFTAIITDPPYSERTHAGHDASANGHAGFGNDGANRTALGYSFLTQADCGALARLFHGATDGWIVWMTDHTLFPIIAKACNALGRYTFAPVPFVAPGCRVRLSGDGPSSWTDWILVSRTAAQAKWGTLPGAYIAGRGSEWRDKSCIGGKPTALMGLLIEHYAHCHGPICDPMCGAGSTLVAAKNSGVAAVGIDVDESMCEVAARRFSQEVLAL
jgi:hypothetical protein